jgi:hypothetical protein
MKLKRKIIKIKKNFFFKKKVIKKTTTIIEINREGRITFDPINERN